jgi:hypothetical protein
MYNTQHVSTADVPNSALDFLKPQFRGKSVTPYPADDDATLWLFHKIALKYGWDYMDKYIANKPNFIQGHLPQQRSIGTGQNWVTFDSIFSITGRIKQDGAPVQSHFSTVDADLAAYRRGLQECAASECGEAVHELVPGAGASGEDRYLVETPGRSATERLQANPVVSGGQ